MVKAVPSYRYFDKKWFYVLQKLLAKKGNDGFAWLAKRKEEEKDDNNKRTVTRRRYFCIKQFPMTYKDVKGDYTNIVDVEGEQTKARTRIVNEMVALSSLNDSKYV
jgi:hypothetical protein